MTRNEAKKAISCGRVTVGGNKAKSGSLQVNDEQIALDGESVEYQRYFYIMMNKPQGYVCANSDSRSKTVFDLLSAEYRKKDLFVCGRLDKDTTGFVLLTNNGDAAHRLLAPRNDVFKEYRVVSKNPVSKTNIATLEKGLILRDGTICKPAFYCAIEDKVGMIKISEGKFHQIKKMFFAMENEVLELHRCSIHGLTLDNSLAVGEYRYLTEDEVNLLLSV
jgi:16S rRNA pseudouridine516 synthase